MKEIILNIETSNKLAKIYEDMASDYDLVANTLDFSCSGCDDNCCDSYFLHYTYTEWAYLWQGLRLLDENKQQEIISRAKKYNSECDAAIAKQERPQVMCPLNENGLCILYHHRLMVCRTHGVPASMTRPDGQKLNFPGCFRCQEIVKETYKDESSCPRVERTPHLRQLAMIENELFAGKRHLYPKVKLTIAQMIIQGVPHIPTPHCERTL